MDIRLYNTLTKKIEVFEPLEQGKVSMYSCGPTVYNFVHIGNLRSFLLADLLRRTFEYSGYDISQAMNITDVDDKTIKKSIELGIPLKELTSKYESEFLNDLEKMNILKPKLTPRATESVASMIELVSKLISNETAYKADDGVYFSISKSKNYGQLVGLNATENKTVERIHNDEYDKENPRDFVLWKFHTETDGDVYWDASFGKGRPGWNIECSAMAMEALGETIDIHTGGIDLMFPHHTNEIAQSESATGKQFVRYWLHNGFISINDTKISKSLKNEINLKDILEKGIDPLAYRYWLLTSHYQSLVNFTWEALDGSAQAYKKLIRFITDNPDATTTKSTLSDTIIKSIFDNLDTSTTIAEIWNVIKNNGYSDTEKTSAILEADKILGLNLKKQSEVTVKIPSEIKQLADLREQARKEKNWAKSDELRLEIEKLGFGIKDTEEGYELYPQLVPSKPTK